MPDEDNDVIRSLQQEIHLLQEELVGLRETLEGVTRALAGAQHSYGAVLQRADLLEKRVNMTLLMGQKP